MIVILLLPDNEDRRALLRGNFGNVKFESCGSPASLTERLDAHTDAVICATGLGLLTSPALLERIESSGVRLIIRCRITQDSAIELAALAQRLSGFQISAKTREQETQAESIDALVNAPDSGPAALILRQINKFVPKHALRFVIAALALGSHRTDVSQYAQTCGLARRSLQAALRTAHLPAPHSLLAWGQACWMVWRMDQTALNSKQAAALGGFASATRMSAALRHLTAHSAPDLLELGALGILTSVLEESIAAQSGELHAKTTPRPIRPIAQSSYVDRRQDSDRRVLPDRTSKADRRAEDDRRAKGDETSVARLTDPEREERKLTICVNPTRIATRL